MDDTPSVRVVEQRVRNRIIECLEYLAMGDKGVRRISAQEYFNWFDGWVHRHKSTFGLSTLNVDEKSILLNVLNLMDAAARKPDREDALGDDDESFIATGWPARIAPVAAEALAVFERRGRFSEDVEEVQPGIPS